MTDTLQLWDASRDAALPATFFVWGAVAPASSAELAFRVRNASDAYTALGVTVSVIDTGSVATPSVAGQHLLSIDGQRFVATADVGDLPPGAVSSLVWLRRATASGADLGLWTFSVLAQPSTWQ